MNTMYLNYYKLRKAPFNITPDPDLLFLSPGHREALAAVIYGIKQRKGFVSIVGEVGVGKTTILRSCLERIDKEKIKIIYLFNPNISFQALVKMIYENIAAVPRSADLFEMVNHLQMLLIEEYKAGRNIVLFIDEAQNMPMDTLESLRMLSNLETTTDKLIQIVFSGQPEFEQKINTHSLRQLKQRITLRAYIKPFTRRESFDYIAHRLTKAGEPGMELFSHGALDRIVSKAGGVPRVINIFCDNCLITAFGKQKKQVSTIIAREVLADYEKGYRPVGNYWRNAFAAVCIIALTATGFLIVNTRTVPNETFSTAVGHTVSRSSSVTETPSAHTEPAETMTRQTEGKSATEPPTVSLSSTKIVKKGDTFAGLVKSAYGYTDPRLFKQVLQHNPGVANVNLIREGEKLIFPSHDNKQSTGNEER